MSDPLVALAAALRAEGGLLAQALRPAPPAQDGDPGPLAAAGPRSAGRREEVALLVEAIHEGQRLHRGAGRLLGDDDPDLALLAGDRLYALGLERLARLGDLDAVAELADAISLCAAAQARGEDELAGAALAGAAAAIGWGPDPSLDEAKAHARQRAPGAAERLLVAVRQITSPRPAAR